MNRLILAALVVVFLVALLLMRWRSARKPVEPVETGPLLESEAVPPAADSAVTAGDVAPAEPGKTVVEPVEPVIPVPAVTVPVETTVEAPAAAPELVAESAAIEAVGAIPPAIEEPDATSVFTPGSTEEALEEDLGIDEISEPILETVPAATEVVDLPVAPSEETAESQAEPYSAVETASATAEPGVINLSLESYRVRLNALEERQRGLLERAVQQGDDSERDRLQRELVIMNDRLALVEDSHAEELASLGEVLATLEQLRDGANEATVAGVAAHLRQGETKQAEEVVVEESKEDKEIAELEAKLAAAKKKQAEDSDADAE